jgi:UDP-2-acetamido-3-amino-2,3-dideoxy-glucuronate N-acetyltransferase
MKNPPKIAVLGCGYWGQNLVRNFRQLNALGMVCEPSLEGRRVAVEIAPDVQVSVDLEDALRDESIQGVAIATPAETHHSVAIAALRAGKHVFVEKPLALTIAEGQEMQEEAKKANRILMVGHLLQYHPYIRKMLEMIKMGAIGKLQYITSNRLNLGKIRREENALWSFAPHDLSVILAIAGDQLPEQVRCVGGAWLRSGIADTTLTTLRFNGGLRAHVYVSWLNPFKEQKLTVIGSGGMIVIDDTRPWNEKMVFFNNPIHWTHGQVPTPSKSNGEFIVMPESEPLSEECLHFLECVAAGRKPRTDATEGLRVLSVLQAAQSSLDKDGEAVQPSFETSNTPNPEYFVHSSAQVDEGANIGRGTKIWHYSHILKSARIGQRCVLGQNVNVDSGAVIGDNVKIQNNVSVYSGVVIEDDVFLGPSCVLTNVANPRSQVNRQKLYERTHIQKGATIGANATIVCGVTIGCYAFVGAGSVVTKDVGNYEMIIGNPGKHRGWMSRHGHKLQFDSAGFAVCPESGLSYRLLDIETRQVVGCLDLDEESPLDLSMATGKKTYSEYKKLVSQVNTSLS